MYNKINLDTPYNKIIIHILQNIAIFFNSFSFYKRCMFIICCGIVAFTPFLFGQYTWHDPQYSMILFEYSWLDMIKTIAAEDGHPPLSYIIFRMFQFGYDTHTVWTLRLCELFFIVLTTLLGMFPVRRLLGDKIALYYVILSLILPPAFILSTNLRMYPLAVYFVTAAFIYSFCIIYKYKQHDWLKFSLVSILGLYTHYYCAFILLFIWLFLFINLCISKQIANLKKFFIFGFIVSLSFLPWILIFINQYTVMKEAWYPSIKSVEEAYKGLFFINGGIVYNLKTVVFTCASFSWFLIIQTALEHTPYNIYNKICITCILITWILFLLLWLISVFLRPVSVELYFIIFVGLVYISLAISLSLHKKLSILYMICCIFIYINIYPYAYKDVFDTSNDAAINYINNKIPNNSLFLYDNTHRHLFLRFYANKYKIYYAPSFRELVLLQNEVINEKQNIKNLKDYEAIYYLRTPNKFDAYNKTNTFDEIAFKGFIMRKLSINEALNIINKSNLLRKANLAITDDN